MYNDFLGRKNIIVKLFDEKTNSEMTKWCGGVNVENLTSVNLNFRDKEDRLYEVLNMRIKKKGKVYYAILCDDKAIYNNMNIENGLDNIDLLVYQSCLVNDYYGILVKSGEKKIIGWDFPEKKKEFIIIPVDPTMKMMNKIFNFTNNADTIIKHIDSCQEIRVFCQILHEENSKIMNFYSQKNPKKSENNFFPTEEIMIFQIAKIGISLITRNKDKRLESFYMMIDKFRFDYHTEESMTTAAYEMKIKSITIDNNWKKDCPHAGLLRPIGAEELYKTDRNCIEVSAHIQKNSTSTVF